MQDRIQINIDETQLEWSDRSHASGKNCRCEMHCSEISCGTIVKIVLIPEQDINIRHIDLSFELGKEFDLDTLVYSNGTSTNDFVQILYRKDLKELVTRDVLMLHHPYHKRNFNIGMVTSNRFLCRFITTKERVTLRYEMENKQVCRNNTYELEEFLVNTKGEGMSFLSGYAEYLAQRYEITLPEQIPCGWSSWSCYYNSVNDQKIKKQYQSMKRYFGDLGADLVQIDDGWQKGDTFCSEWTENRESFEEGLEELSKELAENQMKLGLWLSPTLMSNISDFYKTHFAYQVFENGEAIRSFGHAQVLAGTEAGSVYPLDLGKEEVLDYIQDSLKYTSDRYHCNYYKLDFLIRSLLRTVKEHEVVRYETDYSVAVYKKAMRRIRDAVGANTFLLACGAPITESIGIFDAIRVSPDITWRKKGHSDHPGYWNLIVKNAQNVILRSFYHKKLFINDPDALVIRGEIGEQDDGFEATLEEAKVWATVIALSGGTVLVNERIEALSDERREIIRNVLPPLGEPSYAVDFFEYPYCTMTELKKEYCSIIAAYNWYDQPIKRLIKQNKQLLFDCWSKEFLGELEDRDYVAEIPGHSVKVLLMKEKKDVPCFMASGNNIFMGLNSVTENFDGKNLTVSGVDSKIWIYAPEGWTIDAVPVQTLTEGTLYEAYCQNSIRLECCCG